jgi:ubiquinone/menaquinone biosynthesis C-methylase UbiE
MKLTPQAAHNRAVWEAQSAEYQEKHRQDLEKSATAWGIWRIPESELRVLGRVGGLDVLEFGCGGAQWGVALAAEGGRVVGLDFSADQLAHARRYMAEQGVEFPLVEASGEDVPLPDASFDIVFCDHGVMSFAKPELAVPEAARLLRPGGLFAFCRWSPLVEVCWDPAADVINERLVQDYFELDELTYDTIEYWRGYGQWIRIFSDAGLVVEDLIELRAPEGATSSYEGVPPEWARRWPGEVIWRLRK